MAKLFIVGFPKDMQEVELVELFSAHGTVNTVTIVTDQNTGDSKGYGFITMTDDAGAARAIQELDGMQIDGRTLNVRFAEETARKTRCKSAPRQPHGGPKAQTPAPPALIC